MQDEGQRARRMFWTLWTLMLAAKIALAARLPLFVDEAFYWQEGQHLAWAYSDLPGLTAWLTRLGVELGGTHPLALRAPFLAIGALVPWLLARLAMREYGARDGWRAGTLALLLPLAGTLGLLALPDVPMALATVLCLDAGARLLKRASASASLELAAGLAIGALSHYRFLGVIAVGLVALLLLPEGRRALRHGRVWAAIAFGALAWMPLLWWNLANADAGLRFQLVDRHPWAFHPDGAWFVPVQAAAVTPLLLAALLVAVRRGAQDAAPVSRYFAALGGLTVFGFFALGFFADNERVSFHWPLPGYLALLPLAPGVLAAWPRGWRVATVTLAALGLLAAFVALAIPAHDGLRERLIGTKAYPSNFADWRLLVEEVRRALATLPPGTRVVADNFKVGAQLGFALGDPRIAVLDHPLNHKHGRAPQLRLWGLEGEVQRPALLVVATDDVKLRDLLDRYHTLCRAVGPLPPPQVVSVDHGARRYLLFRLREPVSAAACVTPAIAHVSQPAPGARVPPRFEVTGWAIKDVVGVRGVTVTLDGRPVARARHGLRDEWPARFYRGRLRDPGQPAVGFRAEVDVSGVAPGRHWLGLWIHGGDGSLEPWAEQPIVIGPGVDAPTATNPSRAP